MARSKTTAASSSIDKFVGNRIRVLREERGLKQVELARTVPVDPNTMQRYEGGAIALKAYQLWRIAAALQVSVQAFFEGLPQDEATIDWMSSVAPLNMHAARLLVRFPQLSLDQQRTLVAFIDTLVDDGGTGGGGV